MDQVLRTFGISGEFNRALANLDIAHCKGRGKGGSNWEWVHDGEINEELAHLVLLEMREIKNRYKARPDNNEKQQEQPPAIESINTALLKKLVALNEEQVLLMRALTGENQTKSA